MVVIGLTGGIGSGKSSVTKLFSAHGARVSDSDEIAHRVYDPGTKVHQAVVDRFGETVVADDGTINRKALGVIVFADRSALRDLEGIVHPAVEEVIRAEIAKARADGADVVCDIPLLVEIHARQLYKLDVVVVVDVPEDVAIARLERDRGMSEEEARRRMAAQISRAGRLAEADVIIDNSGTPEELELMVDQVWHWIHRAEPNSKPPGSGPFRPDPPGGATSPANN